MDLTLGSVIVATPLGNLYGRNFWITRNVADDTFTIRISSKRNRATPFSWLVVENDVLALEAEAVAAAAEAEAAGEETEASDE